MSALAWRERQPIKDSQKYSRTCILPMIQPSETCIHVGVWPRSRSCKQPMPQVLARSCHHRFGMARCELERSGRLVLELGSDEKKMVLRTRVYHYVSDSTKYSTDKDPRLTPEFPAQKDANIDFDRLPLPAKRIGWSASSLGIRPLSARNPGRHP